MDFLNDSSLSTADKHVDLEMMQQKQELAKAVQLGYGAEQDAIDAKLNL